MLNLDFFALIFLIVYVGAIAVLFLFVVMMLNIKLTEVHESIFHYLPIGGFVDLFFFLNFIFYLIKKLYHYTLTTFRNRTTL